MFYKNKPRSYCKECACNYMKTRYHNHKDHVCLICGKTKPFTDFYVNRTTGKGANGCKLCTKECTNQRRKEIDEETNNAIYLWPSLKPHK